MTCLAKTEVELHNILVTVLYRILYTPYILYNGESDQNRNKWIIIYLL